MSLLDIYLRDITAGNKGDTGDRGPTGPAGPAYGFGYGENTFSGGATKTWNTIQDTSGVHLAGMTARVWLEADTTMNIVGDGTTTLGQICELEVVRSGGTLTVQSIAGSYEASVTNISRSGHYRFHFDGDQWRLYSEPGLGHNALVGPSSFTWSLLTGPDSPADYVGKTLHLTLSQAITITLLEDAAYGAVPGAHMLLRVVNALDWQVTVVSGETTIYPADALASGTYHLVFNGTHWEIW